MSFYERVIFNPLMDRVLGAPPIHAERSRILAGARGRVLEVGIGTGLNLAAYPAEIRSITALTPDGEPHPLLQERIGQGDVTVRLVHGFAERMPFADGEFDTVVSTFLLCSVRDPVAAVREFRRVLAPGGRLLFVEHVAFDDTVPRIVQRILNPLNELIACGCSIVRDTAETIRANGFAVADLVDGPLEGMTWPHRRVIRGTATPA